LYDGVKNNCLTAAI